MLPFIAPLIVVSGKVLISLSTREVAIIAATYAVKKCLGKERGDVKAK